MAAKADLIRFLPVTGAAARKGVPFLEFRNKLRAHYDKDMVIGMQSYVDLALASLQKDGNFASNIANRNPKIFRAQQWKFESRVRAIKKENEELVQEVGKTASREFLVICLFAFLFASILAGIKFRDRFLPQG